MKLSDMSFGTTDAKNSLLANDPEEQKLFISTFVEPPTLQLEKFSARQKYFVTGLKGTGKTALLRYIALKLEGDGFTKSSFILFKTDVEESLRRDFTAAARIQVVEENRDEYEEADFEIVWRWLIYKKIAQAVRFGDAGAFVKDSSMGDFLALVESEFIEKEQGALKRLVPTVRKGQVEISRSPKLTLDLQWGPDGRAKIDFQKLVRRADDLFEALTPGDYRLNIFFDELEVSYESSKKNRRDSRLIRDLIVSIERLNAASKRLGYKLCLYAAVRSEVLKSVQALGKEINKPIADFGSEIAWNRAGVDAESQPLIDIIEKRLNSSRQKFGLSALGSQALWEEYFPPAMFDQKPQIYILHNSWYRPRDVVRLMLIAQDQHPNEAKFTRGVLESVRKKYSTDSWIEMTEELSTNYRPEEIEGIRYLFLGFRQRFSLAELETHATQKALEYGEVGSLLGAHEIRSVVKDLYRIGVVGNFNSSNEKFRFSFRGDDDILFHEKIYLHNALRAYLSI